MPNELMTEIAAGTNRKLMIEMSLLPKPSTCSTLTIFVESAMNNKISPIAEAGIGIGKNPFIILATSMTIAKIKACCKNGTAFEFFI